MLKNKPTAEVLPLTSLRFFLASWIVFFHLNASLPSALSDLAHGKSHWLDVLFCGYTAVGIFFVLSGFVLALNYPLLEPWSKAERIKFAVARFSRLYPVYILAMVAISPVIIARAQREHSVLRHGASCILNLLMLQSWIPRAALTWNGPGWSLSNEAFFYLCFPLIGAVFFKLSSLRKCIAMLTGLWIVSLLVPIITIVARVHGYADAIATDQPESTFSSFAMFNPVVNLPLFLAGICGCKCFLLLKQPGRLSGKGYLLYAPSFAFLLILTSFGRYIPYPLMHGGLLLPAAVGIVIGLALGDKYLCAILANRTLVFLGKASYAEYLLHFPVAMVFEAFGISWTPVQQILYFGSVLAVSSAVFQFYEDPLQRKLRGLLLRGKAHLLLKPAASSADLPIASP
jgi:peptidoglycan/LPS O-acetylase OafA/YrhL